MKMERPQDPQRIWLNPMPTLPLQPLNSQVLETNIAANDAREFLNQPPPHFIGHDGNTLEMSGDPDFDKLK